MKRLDTSSKWGLAARLLAGMVVVLITGVLTAWLVASAVGPGLFHQHMVSAGLQDHDDGAMHAERAFRDASAVALALALAAAAAASAAVSVVLARRIGRSLSTVSTAAARLGAGRYESRIPTAGLGVEFDELADSFNTMAARLQESERLRARLLADVAHEVRTPVATIAGYLEAVEDGVQDMDSATMAVLKDQTSRLATLAHDLAAVTRAEAGDLALTLEATPPQEILDVTAGRWADRAAWAGVGIVVDCDTEVQPVRVDRHRIDQVLDNLMANALRHSSAGGTVTLRAVGGSGDVTLSVSDTGEGIPPEHLPHLFERFYRADTARDRASGGSGIGLAICKALVEAHGGTITATSAGEGHGAAFVITMQSWSD